MKMLRCKTIASSLVVCPIFLSLKATTTTTTIRAFTAFSQPIHRNAHSRPYRIITTPNNSDNNDCSDRTTTASRRFFGAIDDSTASSNGASLSSSSLSSSNDGDGSTSVTGLIYAVESTTEENPVVVTLYTKEGCTLCDKVSDVLRSIRTDHPHSLTAVDITDPDKKDLWDKYKWDIPVLHVNDMYWTKHKLDAKEASEVLGVAREGKFVKPRSGEPDAGAMERRQAEREG
eukprot:CAMPEP_0198251214 /NCGR_PEP_ID=MMETSP1447-20131203/2119_1 /TAXON_ID=420782 /ORGANISM="Chaetoceros dichaeta, Strain CCMP1751" /LENGTH=230 /DNA_ID=CAMNT_0043936179 /DNA_START=20 /DNA_END=712 /DNA_ORIENTATION=-